LSHALHRGSPSPGAGNQRRGLCLVLFLALRATGFAAPGGPGGFEFVEGEELVYNVRYAFFNLGQIRIKTFNKQTVDGQQAVFASYRGVPFVDLHAVFESTIDQMMYSRRFMGKIKQDNAWDFSRYFFEYDKKRVTVEMGRQDTVIAQRETLQVNTQYQDGLSLFFFARDGLFSGKTANVPTMIKEKQVNTVIAFSAKRTSVEIDAVNYPVDVAQFEGTMEYSGIFGLTGDFEGWFSNDEARIPILAKMKVILGSVTVELMEWKRPGWAPPQAKE
jgi:hypothetical protein